MEYIYRHGGDWRSTVLALIDISYNIWNDMYLQSSAAIGAEIIINAVCLTTPACLWLYLYKHRNALIPVNE
jgi:hypothetical protein